MADTSTQALLCDEAGEVEGLFMCGAVLCISAAVDP